MEPAPKDVVIPHGDSNKNRSEEVKAFDETKAGVKGLVDSGITKIPTFFIHPPNKNCYPKSSSPSLLVPVIDLQGIDVVKEIQAASETWGLFYVVNHGVPVGVLEDLLAGIKSFNEQPDEDKKVWYSTDYSKPVTFFSIADLSSKMPATWRDSLRIMFDDGQLDPSLLPLICRDAVVEYNKCMKTLSKRLSGLLSEAMGLTSDYLSSIECMETQQLVCHYYPTCPEPELTMGITKHTDPFFLTILLQDNKGGLQVLHQNEWVDVLPLQDTLLVILGDFMQIITNDKFKSADHRVLARQGTSRTSAACFFLPNKENQDRPCGPIKELITSDNQKPTTYRDTSFAEYIAFYKSRIRDGSRTLDHFFGSGAQ